MGRRWAQPPSPRTWGGRLPCPVVAFGGRYTASALPCAEFRHLQRAWGMASSWVTHRRKTPVLLWRRPTTSSHRGRLRNAPRRWRPEPRPSPHAPTPWWAGGPSHAGESRRRVSRQTLDHPRSGRPRRALPRRRCPQRLRLSRKRSRRPRQTQSEQRLPAAGPSQRRQRRQRLGPSRRRPRPRLIPPRRLPTPRPPRSGQHLLGGAGQLDLGRRLGGGRPHRSLTRGFRPSPRRQLPPVPPGDGRLRRQQERLRLPSPPRLSKPFRPRRAGRTLPSRGRRAQPRRRDRNPN
jgi:hypothetical protein